MKRLFYSLLVGMFFACAIAYAEPKPISLKITLIRGPAANCLFKRKGKKKWRSAKVKYVLQEGDELQTKDGVRVEMVSRSGYVVRLNENSHFKVKALKSDKQGVVSKVKLWLGKSWFKVKKVAKARSRFEVETPSAVAGVYGTTYRINVADDKSTSVRVYDGQVKVSPPAAPLIAPVEVFDGGPHEVSGPEEVPGPEEVTKDEWFTILGAMQEVNISSDGNKQDESEFDEQEDEQDEWVRWNKERDAEHKWE